MVIAKCDEKLIRTLILASYIFAYENADPYLAMIVVRSYMFSPIYY